MARRPPSRFDKPSPAVLWALAVVLAAGAGTSLWLNLPGQFSPNSVWQLQQGRDGLYNSWHPPVMAWLLGLFDAMTPGAPGFIVFDTALGFGGLFAFAALAARPRPIVLVVAAALSISPLLLIYQGDVWKDVLFANAATAGFASLAWAGKTWAAPPRRYGLIGLAFVLFALAALTRQNGIIAAVWGAAGLIAIAWRAAPNRPGRAPRAIGHGLAALTACTALVGTASYGLALRGDSEPAQAVELEWLQLWDLAGAVQADPGAKLAVLDQTAPSVARFLRQRAAPAWSPQRVDPLMDLAGSDDAFEDARSAVSQQWRALIAGRPFLYARVRVADFGQMLATPDLMACQPLFIGLDGPPEELKALGLAPRHRATDAWARSYSRGYVGTPVLSHLVYAGLALVLLGLAARDLTRPEAPADRLAAIALLAGALSFAASFALIGVACDYRYLYFLDLAAMAALLHRAAVGLSPRAGWD